MTKLSTALLAAALLTAPAVAAEPAKSAPKPAKKGPTMQEIHQKLSTDCFNQCWTYIEKKDRTAEETEDMLLLATASLWHWKQRTDCKPMNLSIGYWQVSRVFALAGQASMAKRFAAKCVQVSETAKLPPFYVGYAYEAAARAEAVAKDLKAAKAHLAKARKLLGEIKDKEERELLEPDLKQLGKIIPE